jgi:formate hydrogenlyase subunit 3/multisubunit Na+/H+ antiporter MnhD subunit
VEGHATVNEIWPWVAIVVGVGALIFAATYAVVQQDEYRRLRAWLGGMR